MSDVGGTQSGGVEALGLPIREKVIVIICAACNCTTSQEGRWCSYGCEYDSETGARPVIVRRFLRELTLLRERRITLPAQKPANVKPNEDAKPAGGKT